MRSQRRGMRCVPAIHPFELEWHGDHGDVARGDGGVNIHPFSPATYAPSNLLLIDYDRESRHAIADRYYDEASDAALAGNPKRAQWCELWARRIA
jgi:hypothetical protein